MRFFPILPLLASTVALPLSAPARDTPEALYTHVSWHFSCPADPIPLPSPRRGERQLLDAGPHPLFRERLINVPFTVHGKLCEPGAVNARVTYGTYPGGPIAAIDLAPHINPETRIISSPSIYVPIDLYQEGLVFRLEYLDATGERLEKIDGRIDFTIPD